MNYEYTGNDIVTQASAGTFEVWPSKRAYERAMSGYGSGRASYFWGGRGATMAPQGMRRALYGLGADPMSTLQVPYVTKSGQQGTATINPLQANCGNVYGMQQMLFDLGYHPIDVDGIRGPQTDGALYAFAQKMGITGYKLGASPAGTVCSALLLSWQQAHNDQPPAPTAQGCPPGQYKIPQIGLHTCMPIPGMPAPAPTPADCPPGQYKIPELGLHTCMAIPGFQPAPAPPPAQQPPPATTQAGLSTGAVVGIVAGSVGLLAILAMLVTKKPAPASYARNPTKKKHRKKKRGTKLARQTRSWLVRRKKGSRPRRKSIERLLKHARATKRVYGKKRRRR